MKNTLLFSTMILGVALVGCNKSTRTSTTASTDPAVTPVTEPATTAPVTTTDTLGAKIDRAGDRIADASRNAADRVGDATREAGRELRQTGRDLSARMTEWRLSNADLEADITANRPVIRTNSGANAPTGKIDEDALEKTIKGKLNADAQLADLKFDVNANDKGEVELEGKARTVDQIAHVMASALDTEGVMKVTSKIKLDPDAGPNRR